MGHFKLISDFKGNTNVSPLDRKLDFLFNTHMHIDMSIHSPPHPKLVELKIFFYSWFIKSLQKFISEYWIGVAILQIPF